MPTAGTIKLIAYAIGAAMVASILYGAWGHFTAWIREPIVAERDAARAELKTCRRNTAALEESVAQQNRAIAAWEAEAERRYQQGVKDGKAAQAKADEHYKAAARELAEKPLDADLCVSARMRAQRFIERRRSP